MKNSKGSASLYCAAFFSRIVNSFRVQFATARGTAIWLKLGFVGWLLAVVFAADISASAQPAYTPAQLASIPCLRAEGLAELTGDILFYCGVSGGIASAAGRYHIATGNFSTVTGSFNANAKIYYDATSDTAALTSATGAGWYLAGFGIPNVALQNCAPPINGWTVAACAPYAYGNNGTGTFVGINNINVTQQNAVVTQPFLGYQLNNPSYINLGDGATDIIAVGVTSANTYFATISISAYSSGIPQVLNYTVGLPVSAQSPVTKVTAPLPSGYNIFMGYEGHTGTANAVLTSFPTGLLYQIRLNSQGNGLDVNQVFAFPSQFFGVYNILNNPSTGNVGVTGFSLTPTAHRVAQEISGGSLYPLLLPGWASSYFQGFPFIYPVVNYCNSYDFCGDGTGQESGGGLFVTPSTFVDVNSVILGGLGTCSEGTTRQIVAIDAASENATLMAHDNCMTPSNYLLRPVPQVQCPGDIVTFYTGGLGGQTVDLSTPTVSDPTDRNPVVSNNGPALYLSGLTTVTWKAVDSSGYTGGCTQTVALYPAAGLTPTTTVLSSSQNPSNFGQSVTFTATITPQGGVGTVTGTANFFDGGTQIGSATVINNSASFTTSTLTASTHPMTATFSGDATFAGSTSSILQQMVNAVLVSITATPANQSIPLGATLQYTATGNYNDGSMKNLTGSVTWSVSNPTVASIAAGGLAKGLKKGSTTVLATLGSINGSTTLTVTPKAIVSIAVTPPNPTIPLGKTEQFAAAATYSDGSHKTLKSGVSWTSGTPAVATISSTGLATSVSIGTTLITASFNGVTGSATLTVGPAVLVSINITPPNPSIANGATQQFTATGTYTDGSMLDLTSSVAWSSSLKKVATIVPGGLATAVGVGQTTIKAKSGHVSGTTVLTVTP